MHVLVAWTLSLCGLDAARADMLVAWTYHRAGMHAATADFFVAQGRHLRAGIDAATVHVLVASMGVSIVRAWMRRQWMCW